MTQRETIDFLCYDLPDTRKATGSTTSDDDLEEGDLDGSLEAAGHEQAPLLDSNTPDLDESFYEEPRNSEYAEESNFATLFANLNALEIAAVASAKSFLSQKTIQHIIESIWKGDIVFWETLGTHSTKHAKMYRKDRSDPFCRLRVPLYLKTFEVLFFAAFLAFYYIVLVQKHSGGVTGPEVLLYVWLASFSYNGMSNGLMALLKLHN